MSYRIGVISDTHGLLREEVKERLTGCDRIFHAGDINTPVIVDELNRIAPTCLVRGNADKEWAENIPVTQTIDDIGIKVLMIHNRKQLQEELDSYDLVIYGHSHKYEEKHIDGRVWLNPGSCGPRRFRLPITMAILNVEKDGKFKVERIEIEALNNREDRQTSEAAVNQYIQEYLPSIMREIDKGASVEQLAKRFHLSKEMAEQICRLYLTHPGVDADGILAKMGL